MSAVGQGGFARAIAQTGAAALSGIDARQRFISFARALPRPQGSVEWNVVV